MKDVKGVFRNLEKMLQQASWFDDGWEIYNRGNYLQLYKENWFNHNQGGVHFETFIEAPQIKQKQFPVCVHAEEDCPSQSEFIRQLMELEGERIQGWKGYKALDNSYGICQRTLPLNFKNLEQRLFEEFNRLRMLEASIEKVLQRL
ncbi:MULTISPECIES: hypothetical protein [Vibrio]|uniref:Uncharacterized protein n=1 Tax=Vibrio coralliilyticus TaxID=190893 RepID=A0AAP6ZKE5_9VIBR|nr:MULTISPECIES: hypothetical protein [Vibrio]EEX31330.1 hypothetical protein VIC_004278 [Vibrio coralliilyticus ATCC BAA-450]MCC2523833.1 hypothetical protein [Vibrio coralliilyticus]MDE3896530.1 hypothetical protein [Vibrio sp. CC007]NOJ23506.1 hypothetical protein [Vibrio coralliilyticus]NRF13842.1 hypothetical protein [Vibrio coralliilyticus]